MIEQLPAQLDAFSPKVLEAFDTAIGLYLAFQRAWGQHGTGIDDGRELRRCADVLGVSGEGVVSVARLDAARTPEAEAAARTVRAIDDRIGARLVRRLIFSMMAKAFAWSAADLLRARLTSAIGLQRPVIEGYGVLAISRKNPSIAEEWQNANSDNSGKRFFDTHQSAIKQAIKGAGLLDMYQKASSVSLHLRFSGAAFSLRIPAKMIGGRTVRTGTELSFGEFDPERPFSFIVTALDILRYQARLFVALPRIIDEMTDPIWIEARVPMFVCTVEQLYHRVRSAFPEDTERLERKYGPFPILGPSESALRSRLISPVRMVVPWQRRARR